MKQLATILFIFMLPIYAASADVVTVVSGEHEGYTRLVLTVSPDREWYLDVRQTTARLKFTYQDLEFDDSEVFARIPRTRLVSTRAVQSENNTEYVLDLGCDCEVRAFPYLDSYIVIDIADPPNSSIEQPPARHFAPVLGSAMLPDANYQTPVFVSWTPPSAPRYFDSPHGVNFPIQMDGVESFWLMPAQSPDAPPSTPHDTETSVINAAATHTEAAPASDEALQEAVDAARSSLLQQLTLAADQGLLKLNSAIPAISQADETAQEIEPTEVVVVEMPEEIVRLENDNQVLIQTVFSRDANAARGGEEPENSRCPSQESLDIATWGSGNSFSNELSDARKRLLKEFDEPDFAEVERLIRTYLRYGLGAEARSYLFNNGQNLEESRLLLDLSAVVDGLSVQPGGPLSQAIGCDGVAGLWAVVGAYPNVEQQIGDKGSIIDAFSALPPDIRRMLGPRLASTFLDSGFDELGRQVSNILQRTPGDHGNAHELVVGNLMEVEGSTLEAGEAYQALIEENTVVAPDALIELATLGLKQDQPSPVHLLLDLGSAANMMRGTKKGGQLRRLESLWMARVVGEAAAINLLIAEIVSDPVNADLMRQTAEEILSALSTNTKLESSYAEIVYSYSKNIPMGEGADSLRLEIAGKLLLSGLPDYSIEILQPLVQRNNLDALLLSAQANMRAYRPDSALQMLKSASGDEVGIIRVEAYLGLENFDYALDELDNFANRANAVVMPHWFEGDWATVVVTNRAAAEIRERYFSGGGGGPGNTQKMRESEHNNTEAAPITLSAMQDLLSDSQAMSHELENILLQQ